MLGISNAQRMSYVDGNETNLDNLDVFEVDDLESLATGS